LSKITHYASELQRFCRSRFGARLLLVLSCVLCVSLFSPCIEKVDITADGDTQTCITLRTNPQEIMSRQGLVLDTKDSYRVITEDANTTSIEIVRAFDVTVWEAGAAHTVQLSEGTVADAIALAGIAAPDEDDAVSCSLTEPVFAGMEIRIERIRYEQISQRQVIEYKTTKRETADLYKGQTRVSVKGVNGERVVVTRIKYVDGAEAAREVISENVVSEPVNEVVDVGTAAVPTTKPTTAATAAGSASGVLSTKQGTTTVTPGSGKFTDQNGREVAYTKVLTGKGTAYTAKPGALTATGRPVEVGLVAVDPKVIPYGTNLYIVSSDGRHVYGYALAADTGGALKRGEALVDLFYETESQCMAFGRRDVVVYVLA